MLRRDYSAQFPAGFSHPGGNSPDNFLPHQRTGWHDVYAARMHEPERFAFRTARMDEPLARLNHFIHTQRASMNPLRIISRKP